MTLSARQKSEFAKAVDAGFAILKTVVPLTAVEWADSNFYLSAESSYVKGPWTTVPNQVAILNAMGNDDIEEVNWLKSARVGYTKCLTAAIMHGIEHKGRNIAIWQPDDGARDTYSKRHIDSAIRDVPAVRDLFPWLGKKHKNNTIESKLFTNQHQLYLRGGKAAKNYREISVDMAIYDELSKFDRDIEHEGSPLFIGDKRLEGSVFRKSIRGSTPGVAGRCQITEAADAADCFLRRYVPCPHCGKHQVLVFGGKDESVGLKWRTDLPAKEQPKTARYLCRHCGGLWEYAQYIAADFDGYWADEDNQIKTVDGLNWTNLDDKPIDTPISVAFHLWAAYSHFSPWSRIVQDWRKAQKSPEELKAFVNTTLGEAWEEDEDKLDSDSLHRKREYYPAEVPVDRCVLTAAVDVQDDRLELLIKAWVSDEESYNVRYDKLYGDLSRDEIWARLHQELSRSYRTPTGSMIAPRLSLIDTGGHFTDEVHRFSRRFGAMKYIPIKGHSARGKPIATWPKKRDQNTKTWLVMIGTDTAKDVVHQRLNSTVMAEQPCGPGHIHWPSSEPFGSQFTTEFFTHLTNEARVPKIEKGRRVVVWDAKGKRNEPWDLEVYNLAGIRLLQQRFGINLRGMTNTQATSAPVPQPTEQPEPDKPVAKAPARKPAARKPRRPNNGFFDE